MLFHTFGSFYFVVSTFHWQFIKVRTDSSTEFGSNPIFIDRIRIESVAGSNPILIVQIRTALDRVLDFNERLQPVEHDAEKWHQRQQCRHTAEMQACT